MLDRNALHPDAGAVSVQYFLHPLFDLLLDFGTPRTQRVVQADTGDNGSHRALRDLPDRGVGIGQLEQVKLGATDIPANRIGKVDDILVTRQDQIFALGAGRTDVDRADFLDVDGGDILKRRRQRQADARRQCTAIFAQQRHDAALLRAHAVEAGENQPQHNQNSDRGRPKRLASGSRRKVAEPATAATLAKAFTATAQQLLDG